MIYGKPYGAPAACSHCGSRSWTTCDECHSCGRAACSDCASVREDSDPSTGYRGSELICNACEARATKDIVCESCLADRADVLRFRVYDRAIACCDAGVPA